MSREPEIETITVDDEAFAADMYAYLDAVLTQDDPVDYCARQAEDLAIARMEEEGVAAAGRSIAERD